MPVPQNGKQTAKSVLYVMREKTPTINLNNLIKFV